MNITTLPEEIVAKTISILMAQTEKGKLRWDKHGDESYTLNLDIGVFRLTKNYDKTIVLFADYAVRETCLIAGIENQEELLRLYQLAYKQNPNVEDFLESFIKKFPD